MAGESKPPAITPGPVSLVQYPVESGSGVTAVSVVKFVGEQSCWSRPALTGAFGFTTTIVTVHVAVWPRLLVTVNVIASEPVKLKDAVYRKQRGKGLLGGAMMIVPSLFAKEEIV